MMKIKFTKKEIKHIVISVLLLGFIFSFREWGDKTFDIAVGLSNLLRAIIAVAITLLLRETFRKIIARHFGASTEYELWSIKRFWFTNTGKLPINFFGVKIKKIYTSIILPLFLVFISNGKVIVASVSTFDIKTIPSLRLGKSYKEITEYQTALIALSSNFISLLIVLFLSSFTIFDKLITINIILTIYSFIPLSKLDGAKIFFGSIPLYLFSAILIFGSFILSTLIRNLFLNIILALLTIIILIMIYWVFSNK